MISGTTETTNWRLGYDIWYNVITKQEIMLKSLVQCNYQTGDQVKISGTM